MMAVRAGANSLSVVTARLYCHVIHAKEVISAKFQPRAHCSLEALQEDVVLVGNVEVWLVSTSSIGTDEETLDIPVETTSDTGVFLLHRSLDLLDPLLSGGHVVAVPGAMAEDIRIHLAVISTDFHIIIELLEMFGLQWCLEKSGIDEVGNFHVAFDGIGLVFLDVAGVIDGAKSATRI